MLKEEQAVCFLVRKKRMNSILDMMSYRRIGIVCR